jgi:putative flippase GtrA
VASVGTVRLTRALYARFRLLACELGKFGIVGVAAFAVTDAGTNLLHFRAGLGPLNSNVIATVVAMAASYAGNRYWSYKTWVWRAQPSAPPPAAARSRETALR